jgi:hypothetical protein
MARSDALQGALPMLVLKILARRRADARLRDHHPDRSFFVRSATRRGRVALPGAPSTGRSRLVKRGGWTAKNRRARVYDITAAGRRQLEAEEQRWRKVTLAVGQVLERI